MHLCICSGFANQLFWLTFNNLFKHEGQNGTLDHAYKPSHKLFNSWKMFAFLQRLLANITPNLANITPNRFCTLTSSPFIPSN
ncbi:hypothetical protein L596_029290 [Steinernema carpocapsae]|uniref:Uncharacterized protein n=1 Tax=Steinernema carpocapsae TaxID=34508 RepID=A0A4U5LU77_STECR|nr:hypothetical protein L596_029290 [Steinernema carpocapsae]